MLFASLGSAQCRGLLLSRVTTQEAMSIRSTMLEKGCSGTYANNTMRTLKAIFNYGVRTNYVPKVPFTLARLRVQRNPAPLCQPDGFKSSCPLWSVHLATLM